MLIPLLLVVEFAFLTKVCWKLQLYLRSHDTDLSFQMERMVNPPLKIRHAFFTALHASNLMYHFPNCTVIWC